MMISTVSSIGSTRRRSWIRERPPRGPLDDHADRLRAVPGVDAAAARDTYRRHRLGEVDAAEELYRLLSVLEMPLTGRLLDE